MENVLQKQVKDFINACKLNPTMPIKTIEKEIIRRRKEVNHNDRSEFTLQCKSFLREYILTIFTNG